MKALIDLPVEINQVLNIVKAQYNLRNKAEAITKVVGLYMEEHMEPELRPQFVQKIMAGEGKPHIKFKTVVELRKRYE